MFADQIYLLATTGENGRCNVPKLSSVYEVSQIGQEFVRVLQITDLASGAVYLSWVVYCNSMDTTYQVFENLMHNTHKGPFSCLDWDVLIRNQAYGLPQAIRSLSVALYKFMLPLSGPYTNTIVFEHLPVLQGPASYWRKSSPVLGYMGSLTVSQHKYGLSAMETITKPRCMRVIRACKVGTEHLMYNYKENALYEPYLIKECY